METMIGGTLIWLLGNYDLIKLLCCMTLGFALIHTVLSVWQAVERNREYERI